MGNNPFLNRTMIKNPEDFFGRKNELRTIFTRLPTLQSCDVYGERKIGKSSLLYYIFKKIHDELGDDYSTAYIDLQDAHYHTVEDFLKNSLNELGCKSEVINTSNGLHKNLVAFTESINELRKKKKPILLIDEFESLTEKSEFKNDVFEAMRSLGTNGNIAYITASLNSLKTLCKEGHFTSPFYNIFSEVPIGPFAPDETLEFLSAQKERVGFNEKEIEFIYEIANNHPLHLQIACYHVFENKGKNWDEKKLREDIESEIKTYDDEEVRNRRHHVKSDTEIQKEKTSIDDQKNDGLLQKIKSLIDLINPAATIASFVGFFILEILEIYPSGYNKHVISVGGAILIFLIVFLITSKKKYVSIIIFSYVH